MAKIWVLAAGALTIAVGAVLASWRAKRQEESGQVSVASVSDQWLSEQRARSPESL